MFSDVDLDKCLPTMIKSSFANQGEICLTSSRIFVQEDIYETFVERFVERTRLISMLLSTTLFPFLLHIPSSSSISRYIMTVILMIIIVTVLKDREMEGKQ